MARRVKKLLEENDISVLSSSYLKVDLNSIEHLWNELRR